ncbi:hypothetical protein LVJ94_48960 [Pendulispora rubella]|uniref:Uncharacterized protein n=1 Tax=Pendulispora rubella TaxID=2741070 RepID=A0ABZ2L7W9_9BACT
MRITEPRAELPAKPEPMDRDGLDLVTGKDACVAGVTEAKPSREEELDQEGSRRAQEG